MDSMDSSIIYRFTMDYNNGLFKEYQVLCTIVLSMNNIKYSTTMIIMNNDHYSMDFSMI
jgi:hypothetical protein